MAGLASCARSPWQEPGDDGRPVVDRDAFDQARAVDAAFTKEWENPFLFPLPVQSGEMAPTRVLVQGYTTDRKAKRLRVWRDGAKRGQVLLTHDVMVEPNGAGYLRFSVENLAPDTVYHFAFFSTETGLGLHGRTVIGRVRTAFPEGQRWPITVGATTCTHFRTAPFKALKMTAREPVDMTLHLGDMSYNDFTSSLEGYRDRWRMTMMDPGYRALLPHAGMYAAWDDHEFTNDVDPEKLPAEQMAAAKHAFFEALAAEPGPEGQLWKSHRWGDTAEFIILDARTERRPSTRESEHPQYISDAQMEFLKTRLRDSPCHFRVVLNSVPMTRMPPAWAQGMDAWPAYEKQRSELLDFIEDNRLRNVWFLSGDFHVGFVSRLEETGFRSGLREIAVGPGGNDGNPAGWTAEHFSSMREQIFPRAQFDYGSGHIAMTTLRFDPIQDTVRVRFVDAITQLVVFDRELRSGT